MFFFFLWTTYNLYQKINLAFCEVKTKILLLLLSHFKNFKSFPFPFISIFGVCFCFNKCCFKQKQNSIVRKAKSKNIKLLKYNCTFSLSRVLLFINKSINSPNNCNFTPVNESYFLWTIILAPFLWNTERKSQGKEKKNGEALLCEMSLFLFFFNKIIQNKHYQSPLDVIGNISFFNMLNRNIYFSPENVLFIYFIFIFLL